MMIFFSFSFSGSLSLSSLSLDPDHSRRRKKKPLKKLRHQISKGAMRGVNVVAMEELSEEAIAAARSRRMRER